MTRWIPTLFLAAALAAPLCLAASTSSAQPASVEEPEASKSYWQSRYLELKAQVSDANARLAQAKREYNKAKQRSRLRGDAKNSILMEIQSAEMDLENAQRALDALPEEARAAGVPPGWFREVDENYEG